VADCIRLCCYNLQAIIYQPLKFPLPSLRPLV